MNVLRQRGDLAGRQMPPCARRQAGQANAADPYPDQARYRVAESRHHPAHLPIAAFINRQLHFALPGPVQILLAAQQADILRRPGHAVVQHDAAPKPPQRILAGNACDCDSICFRHMVARMGQFKEKIAVVSQKNQPLAVGIQTPHRTQHRLAADVHQIRDHLPGVTVRVGARRDNSLRLIHREIVAFQRRANDAIVKQDFIGFGIHFRA